jgi:hypothetical protein
MHFLLEVVDAAVAVGDRQPSSGYWTVIGFWSRYLPVIFIPTSVV